MQRITFRAVPHDVRPGVEVLQILLDGVMCATIFPDFDRPGGIKLVSAHFAGELTRDGKFPEGVSVVMETGGERTSSHTRCSYEVRYSALFVGVG